MKRYYYLRFLNSTIPNEVVECTKELIRTFDEFNKWELKFGRTGTQGTRLLLLKFRIKG